MRASFVLCLVLFAAVQSHIRLSHVVTKRGAFSSGQEISFAETVTEDIRGDVEGSELRKRSFRRRRDAQGKVECPLMKPPNNGFVTCRWSNVERRNCNVICIENYKFPDGSAKKVFNCTRQGEFWNKIDQPFDCQPAKPGIGCDRTIHGKNQLQLCITYNDRMECQSTCNPGYKFPNGETQMAILCTKSNGSYQPVDKFPDCVEGGADVKVTEKSEANEETRKELEKDEAYKESGKQETNYVKGKGKE